MSLSTLPIADTPVIVMLPAKARRHGKCCDQFASARRYVIIYLSFMLVYLNIYFSTRHVYSTSALARIDMARYRKRDGEANRLKSSCFKYCIECVFEVSPSLLPKMRNKLLNRNEKAGLKAAGALTYSKETASTTLPYCACTNSSKFRAEDRGILT